MATVVFGEDGDNILLGAATLESLGLGLDPLRRSSALCERAELGLLAYLAPLPEQVADRHRKVGENRRPIQGIRF